MFSFSFSSENLAKSTEKDIKKLSRKLTNKTDKLVKYGKYQCRILQYFTHIHITNSVYYTVARGYGFYVRVPRTICTSERNGHYECSNMYDMRQQ